MGVTRKWDGLFPQEFVAEKTRAPSAYPRKVPAANLARIRDATPAFGDPFAEGGGHSRVPLTSPFPRTTIRNGRAGRTGRLVGPGAERRALY